jgi:predicted Zn-dependent peptidase/soluble lytic murein transglycosylase-like protein
MKIRARRAALGAAIAVGALGAIGVARSPSARASFSAAYRAFRDPSLLSAGPAAPEKAPALCAPPAGMDTNVLLDAKIASDFQRATNEDLDDPEGATLASLTMPDLRVPVTRRTMRFVRFFARTEAGRQEFLARFRRAGSYRSHIEHTLREAGLPEDLVWVPAVESGFDPRAVSHAGAAGLWQFMPHTGAVYGLHQSGWVDERKSIVRATTAAAAHLRDLYERFGRWDLALAAYNVGYDGVLKAMDRATVMRPAQDQGKPIDFAELAEAGLLPEETINYVPQISAFAIVAANRARFGLDAVELAPAPSLELGELAFPEGTRLRTIARAAGISIATLREYNPEILRDRLPPTGGDYLLHLPADRVQRTLASFPAYLEHEVLGADEPDLGGPAGAPNAAGAPAVAAGGDITRPVDTLPRRPSALGHNRIPEFALPGEAPSLLPTNMAGVSALGAKLPVVMVGGGLGWQRPYEGDPLGVFGGAGAVAAGAKGREPAIEKQLGFLGARRSAAAAPDPFERFTLTNGIAVDLRQDPSAPRVAITVRIAASDALAGAVAQAGSSAPAGASGAEGEAEAPTFSFGTGETRHTITVLPRDLDIGIELAAGRLKMLLGEASDAHVAEQRKRLTQPKRRALAETPYGQAYVTLSDTLFPEGHPLAGTVIGAREDAALMRDLLLAEILRQERTAKRASVTLVGEVNRPRAQMLLEQLLGPVASPLAEAPVLPHPRETRVVIEDGVPSPRTLFGWIGPREGDPGDAALRVAMEILIGAKQSRLDRVLKEEEHLASLVKGTLDVGPRASIAAIEIAAAVPHDAGEVERRMDAELAAIAESGPTVQEVAFAKGMLKHRLQKELASASGPVAPNAPMAAVSARIRSTLRPGSIEKFSATLDDVSPHAVKLIVRKVLSRNNRVVVTTIPRGGGGGAGGDPGATPTGAPGPAPAPLPSAARAPLPGGDAPKAP